MAGGIFVAKKTASMIWQGRHIVLEQGVTTARAGHPLLDAAGDMFEPLHIHYDVDDEAGQEPAPQEPSPSEGGKTPEDKPAAKAVRAWAAENGVDVPARGKIPDDVYEQYLAAQK